MVREIITAPVVFNRQAMVAGRNGQQGPTPLPFYQTLEMKPENLAAATSRLFLGVKLECAQCHNHPFAKKWKREFFWEYAAFFSGIQTPPGQGGFMASNDLAEKRDIKVPGRGQEGDKVVQARFLDQSEPKWKTGVATRKSWPTG